MSTMTEAFQPMSQRMEPDIQATLSDFLTYTEHFPSQLIRALTLIQSESRRAEEKIAAIHKDTTLYIQPSTHDNQVQTRKRISHALDDAESAGRMRLEEAVRLRDTAVRENARLHVLTRKLKAIPLPSRDPTPEETVTLTSPGLGRTARFGDALQARRPDKAVSKLRARKIMVPGEVLPPPDPNAPPESLSDWTSPRNSPDFEEEQIMRKITPRPRSRTPRIPRLDGEEKRPKPRGPRQPGQPGTNAHSAVAGISTSNALLALNPPPDDAIPGSRWLPWMKLTEWEMAKLRKRMKKNAIWVPSATMVRRELKNLGRGVAGREAARAAVETKGTIFMDEAHEPDPTKVVSEPGNQTTVVDKIPVAYAEEDEDADAELINRGMRLNEAKKLKRARMLEEQREAAAQIAREQGQDDPAPVEPTRKRKREPTPDAIPTTQAARSPEQSKSAPAPRRIRITHISSQVPQQDHGSLQVQPNQSTNEKPEHTDGPTQRKPTIVLKASKAGSEPPSRRASLRRSSIASLPDNTATTRPVRRSKRPAPGVVTGGDEESARVSASRRKAAPRKKEQKSAAPDTTTEDEVDPNEPRYCVCGDVSFGMMIACDNEASCEKEWFHLSCVGLDGLPPRRTKWYCPDCRKKLKTGQSTNGLVGRLSAPSTR